MMGGQFLITSCFLLIGVYHVSTFSISSRHERSTDLSDALAILQRQRRRATSDYLGKDRSYADDDDDDDNTWLRGSNRNNGGYRNDQEPVWVSDGKFVDFDSQYDRPNEGYDQQSPLYVEPSKQELDNIFDDNDDDQNTSNPKLNTNSLPEKKKKEEMVNVKGDGKVIQKKSINIADNDGPAKAVDSNEGLSLDTLTKEEFHALMKAVDKLQKQAVKFSEKTIDTPEGKVTTVEAVENNGQPKVVTIVQPASKEDLKAVFDGEESPVVKETEISVERGPNSVGEKIVSQKVVSNVSPQKAKELEEKEIDLINVIASELEDNIVRDEEKEFNEDDNIDTENLNERNRGIDGLERNWLGKKYHQSPLLKRTMKRSASYLPAPRIQLDNEESEDDDNAQNDDVAEVVDGEVIPVNLEGFVEKIIDLQDEVDNLKIVSQLEDLENDVLTDALNEATLSQKEGSVTDMEFESLQQAIRIEEALQKLKNPQGSKQQTFDVIKHGEPWRRKRDPDVDRDAILVESLPAYSVVPSTAIAAKSSISSNDVEDLLDDAIIKDINDEDASVASFFMPDADQCPGVEEYSTNCELADFYNLPVDFEARSLCNLHEMCYACGNSLKVGQDQCDLVYRAAASALCRGKQNCVLESEIFLRTMKLKNRYIPHSLPLCRSNCVAEFLGML